MVGSLTLQSMSSFVPREMERVSEGLQMNVPVLFIFKRL